MFSIRPAVPVLSGALCAVFLGSILTASEPAAVPAKNPAPLAGAPHVRTSKLSGHVSNYDEAKVGAYTLPDPLRLSSGEPVRDAATWFGRRRPEILHWYETEVYGRVPERAPSVSFEQTNRTRPESNFQEKEIVMRIGSGDQAPRVTVHLYLPKEAAGPVPVLLHLTFFTNTVSPPAPPADPTPANSAGSARARPVEAGPWDEILAHGYGYALLRYSEIQPDTATTQSGGTQALAYAPGQTKPAPDEWGTIAVWAWGASRVLDYLATDSAVDARRIALVGHSRLGKTVLVAGARDPRFALVFSSCSGEMGASLARRDYGETIDDMAENFPWQFAGNFQKYNGHWNDLPVDTHLLIALCAPRPVFVTGGTEDQWADPKGEFLAEVAAGPVYRLLGKKDLGVTDFPPPDTPLTTGELGFHYHTGGHTISPSDWKAFLQFADAHLKR